MKNENNKQKWVYNYGAGKAEGKRTQRNLLGEKGVGLHEMCSIGIPVPPGFTITTDACTYYYEHGKTYPKKLERDIQIGMNHIEQIIGKKFGDESNPLIISVGSSARVSMPGLMETILNLGLNDKTVVGLYNKTGNKRFAYDSYRRLIQMFGDIVMGVPLTDFEKVLQGVKAKIGVKYDTQLKTEDLKEVITGYKKLIFKKKGQEFPQDVHEQLKQALLVAFESWNSQKAITYRNLNDIPHTWGIAVNVVAMAFGNMGDTSATGFFFTRNPTNGEKALFGEILINSQRKDLISGIRTPQQISNDGKAAQGSDLPSLEECMPGVYKELKEVGNKLEKHNKDMQNIEFVLQEGNLYFLRFRNGNRTDKAAAKIAVDLFDEGIIDKNSLFEFIENYPNSLINENKKLKLELSNLNKKIEGLNNNILQLKNKNNNLYNQNCKYEEKIKILTTENTNITKKINDREEVFISLMKKIENKDHEINKLKAIIPFELKEGEKLLTVIFVSNDQKLHYSLICKDTEIFSMVEKRLYEIFPSYEEYENCFIVNALRIKKTKSLKDNKIKNSDVILVLPNED